ncbi:CinA family protein [Sanguibacter antarcticus]|uniref:Nicotinamide-nucleotide amidase n=1 Tax=Sanguibacter antarcticus TaxID=372484 RepID=A0A2A9E5Q9_9MICO|nr:CinA family protein [Sanguibacter antarcticus]PFG33509.1 nicotinamide-nucleotide amidase [Sanguibacter antarcticus]
MLPVAARVLELLERSELSLAVAESLTGGLLVAELVAVPGASRVVRGGVVAYATDLKHSLLGVDAGVLAAHGAVTGDVARQMAEGVCQRLDAEVGVATTGVAGPDSQDGREPGTVFLAVHREGAGTRTEEHAFAGDRAAVQDASVRAALALLEEVLR